MKYRILFLTFFLFIFVKVIFSQEDNTDMPKIFYRNEKTIALNLLSNGWGLGYRYGNRINYFEKKIYEIDFSIIHHAKEIKSSSSFLTSSSFVFGKENSVFDLRLGLGKQKEIFGKGNKGSVAVKYFYSLGPAVAILKPIYYEIYSLNDTMYTIKEEKFNPDIHTSGDIKGKASFFTGFNEIKFIPGAYLKAGFNFEFSQSETRIHALEAGIIIQAYLKDLEIMAVDDNQQLFFTLFVSYRFGKIVNAQNISEEYLKKRKKKHRIFK